MGTAIVGIALVTGDLIAQFRAPLCRLVQIECDSLRGFLVAPVFGNSQVAFQTEPGERFGLVRLCQALTLRAAIDLIHR